MWTLFEKGFCSQLRVRPTKALAKDLLDDVLMIM